MKYILPFLLCIPFCPAFLLKNIFIVSDFYFLKKLTFCYVFCKKNTWQMDFFLTTWSASWSVKVRECCETYCHRFTFLASSLKRIKWLLWKLQEFGSERICISCGASRRLKNRWSSKPTKTFHSANYAWCWALPTAISAKSRPNWKRIKSKGNYFDYRKSPKRGFL